MPIISQIGYCKYSFPNGVVPTDWVEPEDVINNRGVNFWFNYSWSGNNCTISGIKWRPGYIKQNSTTGERTFEPAELTNTNFRKINEGSTTVLSINFGGTKLQLTTEGHREICNNYIHTPDNTNNITANNVSAKFLIANFNYSYTASDGVRYYVKIKDIKIPRSNKYENNVIFNKDGLNEMIDYFKKYPVIDAAPSPDFGKIRISMGTGNTKDIAVHGCENSTNTMLKINTNILPQESKRFYLGNNTCVWKGLYAENLGDTTAPVENAYINNGIFNNGIKGKYLGLPNGLTGDTINIGNGKFVVDDKGNVTMKGSISWGKNNPLQCVYHRPKKDGSTPTKPDNNTTSFSLDGSNVWHINMSSEDRWASLSYDGGAKWNIPIHINAQDGEKGDTGDWSDDNILKALESIGADGIYSFPGDADYNGENNKLGIKVTALLATLMEANKIEVNGGSTYSPTDARLFKGGFITFRVPTPWTSKHPLNAAGFSARLGYLRGNGNEAQATAGIGIALQTQATYKDAFPNSSDPNGDKLHLLIASLMLTDSGLGLTLATNTAAYTTSSNSTWFTQDYGFNGKYHYIYKYVNANTSSLTWINGGERGYRLWLHEDNGGLYWLDGNGFSPWHWED